MARILVIDDEEFARYTIRQYLKTAGHEVVEATGRQEGVFLHEAEPFDLVVTDTGMPDNGPKTVENLRHVTPDLPIIAVTGARDKEQGHPYKRLGKAGPNMVLAKPFLKDDLLRYVDEYLPNKD